MLLALLELFFAHSYSKEDLQSLNGTNEHFNYQFEQANLYGCPQNLLESRENYILSTFNSTDFINKSIYGCHHSFLSKSFHFTNCILRIYSSNFTNLNSDKNAIHFNLNSNSIQLLGNIEIDNCRFYNYYSKIGGSIYIFSKDTSRTITISSCKFSSNDQKQTEKGGAIYINAISVNVENTQFLNCYSENGGCLYYTNENNEQIAPTQFALNVKKCTFKNNKANLNGGCLFSSTHNGKITSPINVESCKFSSSSTDDSKEGKGAGFFIESNEINRKFNIIQCMFGRCYASMNGGAIFFNAFSGIIKRCKFSNNHADKGCEIAYIFDSKKQENGEKLTITENVFIRNSKFGTKSNTEESLIFVSFDQFSKIEFTSNHISVDRSLKDVFLFDYPKGTLINKNQLKIADNDIQPSFESRIDSKKQISSQFYFHSANLLEDEYCTKPTDFDGIFECKQNIKSSINADNTLVHVYQCSFTNLKETAISINGCEGNGEIIIKTSSFFFCKNSAISINSVKLPCSISECSFTECLGDNLILFSNSLSGTIEQCSFLDNAGSINYDKKESNSKLIIKGCTFMSLYYGTETFLKFTKDSIFDFTNNFIRLYVEESITGKIFDWPSDFTITDEYDISGNTMYPFDKELFGTSLPEDDEDLNCSSLPDGIDNNGQNLLCGERFGPSTNGRAVTSNTLVRISYSSFYQMKHNDQGGGIYINIKNKLPTAIENSFEIYYSVFTDCSATSGCGIYIESTEPSRMFDIYECTFRSNKNSAAKGSCIFIQSSLSIFKITKCYFSNNDADEGAIYYVSDELSNGALLEETDNNCLQINDCKFIDNIALTQGGAIFISVKTVETPKTIDISGCIFLRNNAIELDGGSGDTDQPKSGAAIYYYFIHIQVMVDMEVIYTTQ